MNTPPEMLAGVTPALSIDTADLVETLNQARLDQIATAAKTTI
jgi:hypothetical protein